MARTDTKPEVAAVVPPPPAMPTAQSEPKRGRKVYCGASLVCLLAIVFALLTILAYQVKVSLDFSAYTRRTADRMGEFQTQIKALATKVDALKAVNASMAVPVADGKILAMAPDGSFVLRGNDYCTGEFSIMPTTSPTGSPDVKRYDLGHPISPEDSDLGSVMVITADAYAANGASSGYTVAFSDDRIAVESVMTDIAGIDSSGAANGCKVWIAEK